MKKIFLILTCTILLSSCVGADRLPTFKVDSITSEQQSGKKYFLVQNKKDLLQFNEFANILEIELNKLDYKKVSKYIDADIIISLTYVMSDPETTQINANPARAQYNYTQASITTNTPALNARQQNTNALMSGFYSGMANAYSQAYSFTYFTKIVFITSYNKKDLLPLWKIEIIRTDVSDDLRSYVPIMIECAAPYFNKNFKGTITCQR